MCLLSWLCQASFLLIAGASEPGVGSSAGSADGGGKIGEEPRDLLGHAFRPLDRDVMPGPRDGNPRRADLTGEPLAVRRRERRIVGAPDDEARARRRCERPPGGLDSAGVRAGRDIGDPATDRPAAVAECGVGRPDEGPPHHRDVGSGPGVGVECRADEYDGTDSLRHERDEGGRDEPAVPVPDDDGPLVMAGVEQTDEEGGLSGCRRPRRTWMLGSPGAGEVRQNRAVPVLEVARDVAPDSAGGAEVVDEEHHWVAGVAVAPVPDDVETNAVDDDVGSGQGMSVVHDRIVVARVGPLQHWPHGSRPVHPADRARRAR